MSTIIHIQDSETYFNLVNTKPCIIKFTASWCGPCRMIAPKFAQLAEKYTPDVLFLEVDIDNDECNAATAHESVQSIPIFFFYSNGQRLNHLTLMGNNQPLLEQNAAEHAANLSKEENANVIVPVSTRTQLSNLAALALDTETNEEENDEPSILIPLSSHTPNDKLSNIDSDNEADQSPEKSLTPLTPLLRDPQPIEEII